MRLETRCPECLRTFYFRHRVPTLSIVYGAGILILTCAFGLLLHIGSGSSVDAESREEEWGRELAQARARSRKKAPEEIRRGPARMAPLEPSSSIGVRDYVVQVRDGNAPPEPDPFLPPELLGGPPAGIDDGPATLVEVRPEGEDHGPAGGEVYSLPEPVAEEPPPDEPIATE